MFQIEQITSISPNIKGEYLLHTTLLRFLILINKILYESKDCLHQDAAYHENLYSYISTAWREAQEIDMEYDTYSAFSGNRHNNLIESEIPSHSEHKLRS